MTASLLTKDALSKLPADLREHIIVENENVYGLTLHMSIGDFERLVAPHHMLDGMRGALTEVEARAEDLDLRVTSLAAACDDCADAIDTLKEAVDAEYPDGPDWPETVLSALADVESSGDDASHAVVMHG